MTQQHPAAWWISAGALATTVAIINHVTFSLAAAAVCFAIGLRHAYSVHAQTNFKWVAVGLLGLVALRVVLQNLLGYPMGADVLFTLPSVEMPSWLSGLRLGGTVTSESVLYAIGDGLRIAAIALVFVTAATVTSPTRILRALPLTMHSAGMVVVIAVTFLPHLLADLSRVRNASRWRGQQVRGIRNIMSQIIVVAESALDRSVTLAAALTVRGYTHSSSSRRWILLVGALSSAGFAVAIAASGIRANLLVGLGLSFVLAWLGISTRHEPLKRTRYRQSEWHVQDLAIAFTPLAVVGTYVGLQAVGGGNANSELAAIALLIAATLLHFTASNSRRLA